MSEGKRKKSIFKRWWFWAIVVIVVIGFAAGGGGDDAELVSSGDAQPASAEPTQEYGVGDTIKLGDHQITVTSVDKSNGNDFDKPKEGREYVIVSVKIENGGNSNISYNPFDFKMSNSQGQIDSTAFTVVDTDTSLSSGELAPGGTISGTIAFEQPKDDPDLDLIFEPNFWSSKNVMINLN